MGEALEQPVPMIQVLDASAMLALVRDEQGADVVEEILWDPANRCLTHAVNLCEVYYGLLRSDGEPTAQAVVADLAAEVAVREDMDADFWQEAGRLKAGHRRVSLADCFCIALAQRVGGQLVTADHHEFDAIVPFVLCPVRFIR